MACLNVLVTGSLSAHDLDRVVIVKSSENEYFQQTIDALVDSSGQRLDYRVIGLDELERQASSGITEKSLLITLGMPATTRVAERFPDQPLLSAYATREQMTRFGNPRKNHIAVLLDQPLGRYLALGALMIDSRKPAIINRSLVELDSKQMAQLGRLGISLSQYVLEGSQSLPATIRLLEGHHDSLLILPDSRLYNRDTLKGVLLSAYRVHLPIISYSPAHVKSGALASIYSSPRDIGRHLAALLPEINRKHDNLGKALRFARYFSLTTNERVAYSLGLDLTDPETVTRRLEEIEK